MMKIRSLPILAALAFTSAFASAQPPATPAKPAPSAAKGIVNIVCNPSCDDVVVAGRSLGPSPVVRAELPAGSYEVTLRRRSQVDTRKQLVVTAGQTASFSFTLTMQAPPPAVLPAALAPLARAVDGWISIQCSPDCDDVVVDGKRSLGRNMTNVALPPGDHEITAKRKGVPDKVITVRILGGQTTALRLAMNPPARVDPVAMRAMIEQKLAARTATRDDIQLLRAICLHQDDKACVANMDARLQKAPSR